MKKGKRPWFFHPSDKAYGAVMQNHFESEFIVPFWGDKRSNGKDARVKVVHWLPGRVRLELPELQRHPELVGRLEGILLLQSGIVKAEANPVTGRLLVCYAPGVTTLERIEQQINRICQLPPEALSKLRSLPHNPAPELKTYELEKLPLAEQFSLTAITGFLLLLNLKKRVENSSQRRNFGVLFETNDLLTVVTSLPILRSAVDHLLKKGCLCTELVAGAVSVSSLFVEGSRLGLFVSWLVYLNTLLGTIALESIRDRIRCVLAGKKTSARIVIGPRRLVVPGDQVANGSRLEVKAGEHIPVDGTVESGWGWVNRMPLQGCRRPLKAVPGETVYAGSVLVEGTMILKALRVGEQTYVGLVLKRLRAKPDFFDQPVNRVMIRLTILTLLTAGGYLLLTRNLKGALNILIVGMPGAAGLATTLPAEIAAAQAATAGVLVKSGRNMGELGSADTLLVEHDSILGEWNRYSRVARRRLQQLNYRLQYLTKGDEQCGEIARQGKVVNYIRQLHRRGHIVGMVGRSNGNTPPLSAADVGIVTVSGDDLHLKAADIIMLGEDPRRLGKVAELARNAQRIALQNMRVSLGSSIIGLGLGCGNFLPPILAAVIQNCSTLVILGNSSRLLLRKRGGAPPAAHGPNPDVERNNVTPATHFPSSI